jgi:hypothetical protein
MRVPSPDTNVASRQKEGYRLWAPTSLLSNVRSGSFSEGKVIESWSSTFFQFLNPEPIRMREFLHQVNIQGPLIWAKVRTSKEQLWNTGEYYHDICLKSLGKTPEYGSFVIMVVNISSLAY